MSQSDNPADGQALLQSMLQRLKLQPGRERNTDVPAATASTWGEERLRGASVLQRVNSLTNGYDFGSPTKSLGISAVDSSFGLKPDHGLEQHSGHVSSPSQDDNSESQMGETKVIEHATFPRITLTRTRQNVPVKSLNNVNLISFKRTDGEVQGEANVGQNQGFTPRLYEWSLRSTDLDGGSAGNKAMHVGNGGVGPLAPNKHMHPPKANSAARRKPRTSESKTWRWSQKIKEQWQERRGSLVKKVQEEDGRLDESPEQSSPQNQPLTLENMTNTSRVVRNHSDRCETSTHSEDPMSDAGTRSNSDFEFGLGSFSLLEEIATGQEEWAKFLNPTLPATSANHRLSVGRPNRLKTPPNPYDSGQSFLMLNQAGASNKQWSFSNSESPPASDFGGEQISTGAFLPLSADVATRITAQEVYTEHDQPEPMEPGHAQLNMQPEGSGLGRQPGTHPCVERADILDNSAPKSRVYLNRKRQHQSAVRAGDWKALERDGAVSLLSRRGAAESRHDNATPLFPLCSPPPPFTSSLSQPPAPPQGVLKHSISQDSEFSMETVTKKRRVEENRHVRFSEEVVTIAPDPLDPDFTDSEDDSWAEDSSVTEQECEVEPAAMEEATAPVRRTALPAWILALKRRNRGRKHR